MRPLTLVRNTRVRMQYYSRRTAIRRVKHPSSISGILTETARMAKPIAISSAVHLGARNLGAEAVSSL